MKKLILHLLEITLNIIAVPLCIIIGTFLMGLVLGIIGKFTGFSLLITISGYYFVIFFITICILCLVLLFLIAVHLYVLIKIIGFKKLAIKFIKVFLPVLVILLIINMIRGKELIKPVIYSFPLTINILIIKTLVKPAKDDIY